MYNEDVTPIGSNCSIDSQVILLIFNQPKFLQKATMKMIQKTIRPASIFGFILFLLISSFGQSARAAMIGTEAFLEADHRQQTRDHLHALIAREQIRDILVTQGISPQEARARIDSLTDDEIDQIADRITDMPAAGDAWGFVIIAGVVFIILFLIVEYTSDVKMFSWSPFGD